MLEDSLFLAALDRPTPADRARFLDAECGGDLALRERVERLLAADSDGGILDTTARSGGAPPPWQLVAGREIAGRYRLVRRLGAGGMGEVWAADQTAPVRRTIALKLIRPLFDPAALLARFEIERQALAVMDHPHIARVFDAGVADGVPFLAMELVEGVPITQYCDSHRLTVRQRLELVLPVCRAVQHAHQKGVIHRDLKPSNILVAEVDGRPASKVIDFGIAKAAGGKLTEETLRTGEGAVLGTPEYMAPEQAGGEKDIDTRADVYSLGVVLYELLAGSTPVRAAGSGVGEPSSLLELLRAVREDEPPPPSRRAGTAPDPATLAAARGTDPKRLVSALGGDLDRMVMKSLEKERGRRYDTAAGMARDVERYLAGEPVVARPISRTERVVRWARRNPVVAGLVGLVGLLVFTVAVGATAFALRLGVALEESEQAHHRLTEAQRDTRRQLWQAQLNRAAAVAQSGLPGQRTGALAQLREALAIATEQGVTPEDRDAFRAVAISALAQPDIEVVREWRGCPPDKYHLAADARLELYARSARDGTVSVRRVSDDGELYRLPGNGRATRISLSDDGRRLAVVDTAGACGVYRLEGVKAERLLQVKASTTRAPLFTPDGGRLVYVTGDAVCSTGVPGGDVRSWKLPGRPHGGWAISPDGRAVAVCCKGERGWVIRVQPINGTGEVTDLLLAAEAESVAWHPGGRVLAAFVAQRIHFRELPSGAVAGVIDGHPSAGGRVAFDQTGDRLFSNDWHGLLRVWDWRAGRQLLTLPSTFPDHDRMVAADGRLFVHGETPAQLRVLRCDPGLERRTFVPPDPAGRVAFADPLGRFVLVGGEGGMATFDPQSGTLLGRGGSKARPFHLTTSGELLTAGQYGPYLWPRTDDPAERVTRFGPPVWVGPATEAYSDTHAASADGRVVALPNHWAGAVVLHRDPPCLPAPTGPQNYVRSCAVSPDGKWVATGSHDCPSGEGARVWDARTGKVEHTFPVPGLCMVRFSPDGEWLATSGGGVRLWRVGSWKEGPLIPEAATAVGMAFAPDARTLAVGGHGMVRIVRLADGAVLARLPLAGQGKFRPWCFSPDGGRLYVSDLESGAFIAWELRLLRQQLAALDLDWDEPPLPPPPPSVSGWRVEFVGAKKMGQEWKLAIDEAWAKPTDADPRLRLAVLAPTPTERILHANLALILSPTRLDALLYRARANLQLKKYREVEADAEAILREVPGHFDATRLRDAAAAHRATPNSR